MEPTWTCPACRETVRNPTDVIECIGCKNVFHFTCSLNKGNISQSATRPNVRIWACSKCSEITPITDPKVSDHLDAPANLKADPVVPNCKECEKPSSSISVRCSTCNEMFHRNCAKILYTRTLGKVLKKMNDKWKCPTCFAQVSSCSTCKEPGENPSRILWCDGCDQTHHFYCVGFTKQKFDELTKYEKSRWKCEPCNVKDTICVTCKKHAGPPSTIIRCHVCQQAYHYTCAKIKLEKFCKMTEEEKNKWECRPCFFDGVKRMGKKVGKHVAISAGLTGACLVGIPLAVGALGFGAAGVTAGSLAAAYQSAFLGGTIAAGSAFSVLQSVGAAGLALSTKVGIATACTAAPLLGKKKKKDP